MPRLVVFVLLSLTLAVGWGCRGHRGSLRLRARSTNIRSHMGRANVPGRSEHDGRKHHSYAPESEADAGTEAQAEVWYPSFSQFYDTVTGQCMHGKEPMTTVEMHVYAMALEACANDKRKLLELPGSLSQFRATQHSFTKASCFVDELLEWSHDGAWSYGTKRPVDVANCYATRAITELYFDQSLKNQRVEDYVGYVGFEQARGAGAAKMLDAITARAQNFSVWAPEEAGAENGCAFNCVMFDADWRQVLRAVGQLRADVASLAERRCSVWAALEDQLGGADNCREMLRLTLLAESGAGVTLNVDTEFWLNGNLADGSAGMPLHFENLAPAKDQAYSEFANQVYNRCEPIWRQPEADRTADKCFRALITEQFKDLLLAEVWQRFLTALCAVEDDASGAFGLDFLGQRWPTGKRNCAWRTAVHGAYLFERWSKGDVEELVKHVRHRKHWAQRVHEGLKFLQARTALRPCKSDEMPEKDNVNCRMNPKAPFWRTVSRNVDALRTTVDETAAILCRTWPEFASNLHSSCPDTVREFLLSLGTSVMQIPSVLSAHEDGGL